MILNDKYETQMKKGVLDMLVLRLLKEEEKYGYQIISELKEKSNGRFALKEGTLYPVLYRLENDRLVESRWSEPTGKQASRKYYALTPQGETELCEIEKVWSEIADSVRMIMEES